MKKKKWLYIALIIVFVASALKLVQSVIDTRRSEEARRLAEEMAKMTTEAVETTEEPTTEAPTTEAPTEPEETDPYYADEHTAELKKMNLNTAGSEPRYPWLDHDPGFQTFLSVSAG